MPQFRQGAAGGILHAREGGAGGGGVPIEHRACGTGLHPHRRDVVGDDVVEFAGDAHPVEGDRLRLQAGVFGSGEAVPVVVTGALDEAEALGRQAGARVLAAAPPS